MACLKTFAASVLSARSERLCAGSSADHIASVGLRKAVLPIRRTVLIHGVSAVILVLVIRIGAKDNG